MSKTTKAVLTYLGLSTLAVLLYFALPSDEEREQHFLHLAFNDPDKIVRYRTSKEFVQVKTGDHELDHYDDEGQKALEAERQKKLAEIVALLERGQLPSAQKKVATVAYTLHDSWDHTSKMLAIKAVGLYASEESKRAIAATSEQSVFKCIFNHGLLNAFYPSSWSAQIETMNNPTEPSGTKVEVAALSEAVRKFGPSAAEVIIERLEQAASRTKGAWYYTLETTQVIQVLKMLDKHSLTALPRLFALLEPNAPKPATMDESDIVWAIKEIAPHNPQRVRQLLESSSIDKEQRSYQAINQKLKELGA
ncbi:MAG TPA: hypothetical protein VJC05_02725 [Candidatus Andersenbacteria bacterium]|nr:hypothetical protein [Candidatus Andersenbacteria bacterium]